MVMFRGKHGRFDLMACLVFNDVGGLLVLLVVLMGGGVKVVVVMGLGERGILPKKRNPTICCEYFM